MAYKTYRLTFKSEEQRGATQPNIVELMFNSDADALQFGHNVEFCAELKLVSVDVLLSSDYSLPYPAGNDRMTRSAVTDGLHWMQMRIYDTPTPFDIDTRSAALITAGLQIVSTDGSAFYVPTAINVQKFAPGPSR